MSYKILKPEQIHTVQGVLFDMDGLVLDTERLYSRFWMEAAHAQGYPMTWEQSLGLRSLDKNMGQRYLCECFGPDISYDTVRGERIRRMDAWISKHGVSPKPGIRQLLYYLHTQNILAAITSSSSEERIHQFLASIGIDDQFYAICSCHDVEHGKPEPDIYLAGASALDLKPECCLALEDSPAGILSAARAGCLPVIVPDLDTPKSDTLAYCFACADSLLDVLSLLQGMNRFPSKPGNTE